MANNNKMGLPGALSYIIGNVVGSGIFIFPTTVLANASSVGVSLIVWAVYVELGTSIPKSGADFAYLCHVKWYPLAFAFVSSGCYMTYPATLAVQADAFSEYVFATFKVQLESETATFYGKKLTGFCLIWTLLFVNFFSLKTVISRFQIVASSAKFLAVMLVIALGFNVLIIKGDTSNLSEPFAHTVLNPGRLVQAFYAGLFSYDGWDILNFGAGELDNPRRTMTFAILGGMSMIGVLYVVMNLSFFAVLSAEEIGRSNALAITFAEKTLGRFKHIMPPLIAILLVGSLNSTMFSASRFLCSGARSGHIPSYVACIDRKTDSPRAALFTYVILAMSFSMLGDLNQLLSYLAFVMWLQRVLTMCALLYIRLWHKPVHPQAIRTPLILPIMFFLLCASLVVTNIAEDPSNIAVGGSVLAGGLIAYFVFVWPTGEIWLSGLRRRARVVNEAICRIAQVVFNGFVEVEPHEDNPVEPRGRLACNKVHDRPHVPFLKPVMSATENNASAETMWQQAGLLTRLVASSVRVSEAAGGIIKNVVKGGDLKVVDKSTGGAADLQTEADRTAQYCIDHSLRAKFGDSLKIIGEEDTTSENPTVELGFSTDVLALDAKCRQKFPDVDVKDIVVWVDPLDGTSEFTQSVLNKSTLMEQVTVLIGIAYKGTSVAGVIHQPFYGENGRTIWGIAGVGLGGIDVVPDAKERVCVTTRSHNTELVQTALDALQKEKLVDRVDRVGGAGYKVLKCLEGAAAYVFASPGCKKWDTAAPEAVLVASGGRLTDISGRLIYYGADVQRPNTGGVLATAKWVNHQDYLNAIPDAVKNALPEYSAKK
ncbi:CRE-AAT-6 protein [Aphelenchoides avenae]|nr:CRE-AAT-6 protein [Aphelenchus avenae]